MESVQEIDAHIEQLQKKRQDLLNQARSEKLQEARALVLQFGLTASELGLNRKGRAAAQLVHEPRYRNPDNPSQTWHGRRGAKPKWVREYLDQGGILEAIAIQK